jgi:hypothetical protein
MIEFKFLKSGLVGMANAPQAGSMAGHLGAAVVTGYFIGENQPHLPAAVFDGIRRDLNRIMGGEEAIWFDPKKIGMTAKALFGDLPDGPWEQNAIGRISTALLGNIARTRQSGHNVIFASIALRAFQSHPELATPAIVKGIAKLITSFDQAHSGRGYYGKAIGWKIGDKAPIDPEIQIEPYQSMQALAAIVIHEVIKSANVHRRGFGGLFHLINHAAALLELDRMGFKDLAKKGLEAHRHHLLLYLTLPDLEDELGKLKSTRQDPLNGNYWQKTRSAQWGAWLTHRIKTLYGFHTLLAYIDDPQTCERAKLQFRYLMT